MIYVDTIRFLMLFAVMVFSIAKFIELILAFPYGFVLFVVLLSTYRPKKMKGILL